jgi:hypothetical protein
MNEIIEKQETSLINPSNQQRGFEGGIDQEDLIIPRAKLIQALSPELTEGLEGIKVGSIINSITKEILPQEFIPIFTFKNYIRFNPRSKDDPNFNSDFEPGAVIWKSTDPHDPRVVEEARFGPRGEKPLAVTFLNFFSYFPGIPMPIIVSFSKTSYKVGKQLLSLLKFCGEDMFARKYRLSSVMETNDIATYAILKVTPVGKVSEEEFKICERLWNDFSARSRDIQVHDEDAVEETEGSRPY